jgi:serine/threonine-protein kinase
VTQVPNPDPERLRRVNALLEAALSLPEHARTAWLQDLPVDERELAPLLAVLLARAEVETDTFMRRPVALIAEALDESEGVADAPGVEVGPYRLKRELGAGGMATVWLAERSDGVLQRQVALKLPRAGWAYGLAQRMAREGDILAALEHPRIARLYDAGVSTNGRPWLAMEYVDGVPIDQYCRERSLDVRQRLRLFLQVTDAVAYAHARLVVHRDLKPGNVLVTPQGEVRLLDFGVAKLLESDAAEDNKVTQFAGRPLTRDYASPEQIRGEPLTVAADVYSLAVLLYELLAGVRPYRLKRESAAALEEAIIEVDVPPASQRTTDRRMARALQGDLDNILAKALRKDPARRYASVESMAADVQRHLDGLPVLARPTSRTYRTVKFVRRHRGAVIACMLVLASLAIGLAGTLIEAQRAERLAAQAQQARDAALRDLSFAEASESFMRFVLSEGAGRPFTTAELLARADDVIDLQYAGNAALRARMQLVLANLFGEYRDYKRALAVVARAQAAAETVGDASLLAMVQCNEADLRSSTGDTENAERLFATAIARLGPAANGDPAALISCRLQRSTLYLTSGRAQEAIDEAQEALRLIGTPRPTQVASVIALRAVIAAAHDGLGQTARAVELLEASLDDAERTGQGGASLVTTLANNLGVLLGRVGQVQRAVRAYEHGLAVASAPAVSKDHALLINYARLLVETGRAREALPVLERATRQSEAAGDQLFHGLGLLGIAAARCELREWRSCDRGLDAARDALRPIVPRDRALWGTVEVVAARASITRGEWTRAREQLTEAMALYDAAKDRNTGRVRALTLLARVETQLGRRDIAERHAERAVAAARSVSVGFAYSEWLGSALLAQGIVLESKGDAASAKTVLEQAREQLQNALGDDAPATREVRARLAGR